MENTSNRNKIINMENMTEINKVEPSIIESSFQFVNGERITVFTTQGNIKTFRRNELWEIIQPAYSECPLSWSTHKTAVEYHLAVRDTHPPECFVAEQSTDLSAFRINKIQQ